MSKFLTIILFFISSCLYSNNSRNVTSATGGTSILTSLGKNYRVHYSVGQQSPIVKIKSNKVNARQGFIKTTKFIEYY